MKKNMKSLLIALLFFVGMVSLSFAQDANMTTTLTESQKPALQANTTASDTTATNKAKAHKKVKKARKAPRKAKKEVKVKKEETK